MNAADIYTTDDGSERKRRFTHGCSSVEICFGRTVIVKVIWHESSEEMCVVGRCIPTSEHQRLCPHPYPHVFQVVSILGVAEELPDFIEN